MMTAADPLMVRLVHDRFSYRIKEVPFNQNLFVLKFTMKKVLVGSPKSGQTWVIRWKDAKIVQFN